MSKRLAYLDRKPSMTAPFLIAAIFLAWGFVLGLFIGALAVGGF